MKRLLLFLLISFISIPIFSQKKIMDQSVYSEWNRITARAITNDGNWIKYHITPGKGDKTLKLYNNRTGEESSFERVKRSEFSNDNRFLVYTVSPATDSVTFMKRHKVKKDKMPKDSLIIIDLDQMKETLIPNVNSFKLPNKWSGLLAYAATIEKTETKDSTQKSSKTGEHFFIYNFSSADIDTLDKVDDYIFSEEASSLVYSRSGKDSLIAQGVFLKKLNNDQTITIADFKGKYENINIDRAGNFVSFTLDRDTTDRRIRPYELYLYNMDGGKLMQIMDANQSLTDAPYFMSKNQKPSFSKDGKLLYFGIAPNPVLGDSLALENEEVQVEVWTTEDPMLYTMQEVQKNRIANTTYTVVYDIVNKSYLQLENEEFNDVIKSNSGNGPYYLTSNILPYQKSVTWLGRPAADYKLVVRSGSEINIASALRGNVNFSPGGKYLTWFDSDKSDWFLYDINSKEKRSITNGTNVKFYNELHDSPSQPRSYGSAGWTEGDKKFLIYDRFDIWQIDPTGTAEPKKITQGRKNNRRHRIIKLDREADYLGNNLMIYIFDEKSKESGYGKLDLETETLNLIEIGPYSYEQRPLKAKDSEDLVFTKASFIQFPDLISSNINFTDQKTISNANPQQKEYRWGSIELFKWQDYNGNEVEGLLVKPEDFDPLKKYPVIVNFYEKSSDGLHRHRAPEPHRSTINYSYYTNKGYVIFNPNISYEIGYPGKSCYNAVISGVEALSKNQFVDKSRIGVQGHSWGGYQIAYLLNKTNIFKCAESGAPVVNMISAYGGIRWGSGMSRMFQYEKTQSRLGKTLWEAPDLYMENSPIFELDKMETPVLILHNDNDGAVPWYQGIEYFMALRRLGKEAWFLNYNGEPHWPLKWENRLDFNKRMEQFFAYYLLDAPMPVWMKKGVSVTNKGINQGFEYVEKE